jgi:hypothetical protein
VVAATHLTSSSAVVAGTVVIASEIEGTTFASVSLVGSSVLA